MQATVKSLEHTAMQKMIPQRNIPVGKTGSPCKHLNIAFFHYFCGETARYRPDGRIVSTHNGIAEILALTG
eukprot:COSAG02_NODE_6605_length_3464_cov_3.857355_3_plen_71_part_00